MCKDNCMKSCTSKFISPNFALLLLRVALGVVFVFHGFGKIQNMDMAIGFFSSLGIPVFLTYAVAWIELLAGIALILGVYTCFAGILIAIIMIFAIILVKMKSGFMALEVDLLALTSAIAVSILGPGKFSLFKGKCCNLVKCSMSSCKGVCTEGKCCDKETGKCAPCDCGDCEGCKKVENKCNHESGCTCGDCGMCK